MLAAVDPMLSPPVPNVRPLPRLTLVGAFTTEPVGEVMNAAVTHPGMARVSSLIDAKGVSGLIAAIHAHGGPPDVVVIEMQPGQSADQLMAELERLSPYCGEATQVFVIGHHNDIALYRRLKREGAADYLVAPFSSTDLVRSIGDHVLSRRESEGAAGVVTLVIGAGGGVGATSIAANLAWLAARSRSSLFLDMSMPMSSLPGLLGLVPHPELSRMLQQPAELDHEMLDRITLATELSPRLGVAAAENDFSAGMDRRGIPSLVETARKSARSITVDFPGWLLSSDTHATLHKADHLVLVATPDFNTVPRTAAILREIRLADGPQPVLVLNQTGQAERAANDWSVAEVARALDVRPNTIVTIPAEPKIFVEADAEGTLVVIAAPDSASARALHEIYTRIAPDETAASVTNGRATGAGRLAALRDIPARLLSTLRK